MKRTSLGQRARYAFDNTMAKGPVALIAWLAVLSLAVIAVATAIVVVLRISPHGADDPTPHEVAWMSLMRTLDPGTMGGDDGWAFRIVMLMVTLGGIFIVSTLIGVVITGMEAKIEQLRKGRSFVMEQQHTLILGWSNKIHTIISELTIANENQKKPRVVVLADKDKVEMEDEVRDKTPNLRNTKVICRRGNPNDMIDLDIANPYDAKSIIILACETEGAAGHAAVNADSQTIKTILAITNNPNRRAEPYHIVAEMRDKKNLDVAKMVGKDEVELILSDDLVARIMVQTCRQSGLSGVYLELMDFDGAEIYFNEEPDLSGKTFGDALSAYPDSAVIGLQLPDGTVKVNPPMETPIEAGAKVIAITEDDDTLVVSKDAPPVDAAAIRQSKRRPPKPERILLLGWNHRASTIVRELNNYVAPGSVAKVVANVSLPQQKVAAFGAAMKNLTFEFQTADTTNRAVLEKLDVRTYDHIILLCYEQQLSPQDADAQTLITLLHLRDISDRGEKELNIVSEMLDMRNRELAEVTKADDFIVSDKLISLLMSQVSENKYLMRVFEDLFDADGSEIYLKPATDYVQPGKPVNFYTVVEAARRRNECAIGYRIVSLARDPAKAYGVKVNPVKADLITFAEEDKVIVLAED
jgi:hypothetical protein